MGDFMTTSTMPKHLYGTPDTWGDWGYVDEDTRDEISQTLEQDGWNVEPDDCTVYRLCEQLSEETGRYEYWAAVGGGRQERRTIVFTFDGLAHTGQSQTGKFYRPA